MMTSEKKHGGAGRGQGRPTVSDTTLNQRCLLADKERWQAAAQAQGLTLSAWVIKILNSNS